ncbi:hypothetical protein GGX14DRAFT_637030 [Mycena pura]|uniref:DUF6729 domain-containing protein n=1 Tax=Mycena pura TaxID=153505 RepID=A0AAD6YD90_9AGAR|nr:hypothetical protein GGX14DRAFT_637030 [Mycena pura]
MTVGPVNGPANSPSGRGRPKGSKNKRRPVSPSSNDSTPTPDAQPTPHQKQHSSARSRNSVVSTLSQVLLQPLRRSPVPSSINAAQNVSGVSTGASRAPLATADIPPPSSSPTASLSTPPPLVAAPSHVPIPPAHHPPGPTTTLPTSAATPSARSTLERARQLLGSTGVPSTLHSTPSPSLDRHPLGVITGFDVQNECDPSSLVHDDGLGEEDDDPDSEEAKSAFPTWFSTRLKVIHEELKHDLHSAGRSRYYSAGTFWIHGKSLWFLLSKINIKPENLFVADFFLWDPLNLLATSFNLPCPTPGCHQHLTREGVVKRPRRVVDIDSCFWLIGYTYGCRGKDSCSKRFRSWDQRVLDRLPPRLASEFPAHLTWRSALSKQAFGVVRSCFQHGMGSSEVSDLFRMQQLRRYDEMRLQYLRMKLSEMCLTTSRNGEGDPTQYDAFPPFERRSSRGYHGFTPSGQGFRDLYDDFMESQRDVLNQHTAMRSARVCAIDHSHKLAKHVFKVDGVPIFTALLTVTNEKGEILICVFVATKSHSQFEDALQRLAKDLVVYGHNLPEVFYTDNMVDKAMLEKNFPSLTEAVVPVDKYSHLPLFSTPDFVCAPTVLDSETAINNAMRAILDDVPEGGQLVVGFDSEWNVDMTQYGRFGGRSPPAVVQIAYRDSVFILQVGEMLSRQRLPEQLVNLLRHAQVIKAGRQVNGDLGRLATAAGRLPGDFCGALDLASFAKQRFLIKKATVSLADLVAALLHQCLPKPASERISTNWGDDELSQAQLESAAPPVILLTDDNKKPAARGVISPNSTQASFSGVNVATTKTRTVLSIHEVLIPGAIIGINKDANQQKCTLADFGSTPFEILAHRSHVRIVLPPPAPLAISKLPTTEPTRTPTSEPEAPSEDSVSAFEGLDDGDDNDSDPITVSSAIPDEQSATVGASTLGPEVRNDLDYLTRIRSRVLKDIFHVFHMLYISRTHGLRLAFVHAFRDACLVPHPADKARIETYLTTKNLAWNDMLRYNPKWLWRHCRRTIPPPEVLYPLVHRLFMLYGPLKDAKTGLPLFNAAAWKIAKNILELIRNGHVSDVPGVILYYCIGFDKASGLPIYRCIRGTNMVEGGVHTHLLAKLPSRGASVRHMVACLLDFVLRHNLTVGHFNSTGKKYAGHDSIWLINQIQEIEITLGEHYNCNPAELSWVNGNLYRKSEQSVGIVKIPSSICSSVDIRPYHEGADAKQKQAYLAKMQGTRKPVLPVHTLAEKRLFTELMRTVDEFQKCNTSISTPATLLWNRHAETAENVYYKLEEQLTAYLNGAYKDSANIRLSCARVHEQTAALQKELDNPQRPNHIVNTQVGKLVPLRVASGFAEVDMPDVSAPPSAAPSAYEQQYATTNNVPIAVAHAIVQGSSKRAAAEAAKGQSAPKKPRKRLPNTSDEPGTLRGAVIEGAGQTALYTGKGLTSERAHGRGLQETWDHTSWKAHWANTIVIVVATTSGSS